MATIYPQTPDPDSPASEAFLFGKLRDRLPDDWTVLHARRFVLPARAGKPAREGEVDFIVFIPQRGYAAIEVKGGGVERGARGWRTTDRNGQSHPIRAPGVQAQAAVHAIAGYLREHPIFRRRPRVPFCWGVAFPDIDVRGDLGPELPRGLVIDRRDLADLPAAVERIFEVHGRGEVRLDRDTGGVLVRALAPAIRLVPTLGRQLEDEHDALVRMTDEQLEILDVIEAMPRLTIEGAAGTGKTLLALERARRLAAAGARVLVLCFNRPLAAYLRRWADGYEVQSYHALVHDLVVRAGLAFDVPSRGPAVERFWKDDAPMLLMEALAALPQERYDAIVVDEGQDFRENWWPSIEDLLRQPGKGSLTVFFDPHQGLYDGGPPKALDIHPLKLRYNCRNTTRIAEYAAGLIGLEAVTRTDAPTGLAVEQIDCSSEAETVEAVRRTLTRLLERDGIPRDQVVVLSTHSTDRSPLGRHRNLGPATLGPLEADLTPGQVRFCSLYHFKGLEADAVILTDVEPGSRGSTSTHLYVAASRARHVLVVIRRVN